MKEENNICNLHYACRDALRTERVRTDERIVHTWHVYKNTRVCVNWSDNTLITVMIAN